MVSFSLVEEKNEDGPRARLPMSARQSCGDRR